MGNALVIEEKALPLGQDIKEGDGKGEAHREIAPDAVKNPFKVTDGGQHREKGLDEHTFIPRSASTRLHIGGIAVFSDEPKVGQDDHLVRKVGNQRMERGIVDIGRIRRPGTGQPPLVQDDGELAPDNPAMIREPFAPNLPSCTLLPPGMEQFNPKTIGDPEHGGIGQEPVRPVLMRGKEAKKRVRSGKHGKRGR